MNSEQELERSKPGRRPRVPAKVEDLLPALSLSDLEAEIERRRSTKIEELRAERTRVAKELREVNAEISALEAVNSTRAPQAPQNGPPVQEAPRPTGVAKSADVPKTAERSPSPPPSETPAFTVQRSAPTAPPVAFESAAPKVPSSAPPLPPAAAEKPPAPQRTAAAGDATPRIPLGRVVLESIGAMHPQPMHLREILARVGVRIVRPDLERAVLQSILDHRGKGTIDAAGFEEYVLTEAGLARLRRGPEAT